MRTTPTELVLERLRKDIEWYETFGDEHASLVQTLQDARDEIDRLKTRGGIARSLIPASRVAKFHGLCEALGV